jgi:hypothetical protein
MQSSGSRIRLYGLAGAACVGFLGLDQVAASYTAPASDGITPQVSAAFEHVGQSQQETPAAAPPAKPVDETPPRQRPAINGSLGEGTDALDAKELRRKDKPMNEEPPPDSRSGQRVSEAGEALVPRRESHEAPPLTSEVMGRGWSDPESQAQRGQRSAENGGPAPLWLEAIANQFGVRARFIPLHRPSNTVSRYVDPCDKRDYRCQEFHDNFFREDVETSPLGMANSVGAGVTGGIIRAAGTNREIKAPLMWTVKPRFVGLEAAF